MNAPRQIWFRNESLAPSFSVLGIQWAIPVSWQGWTVLALYAIGIVAAVLRWFPERWGTLLLAWAVLTGLLLLVSALKGERARGHGP